MVASMRMETVVEVMLMEDDNEVMGAAEGDDKEDGCECGMVC